ncbi:MAG: hypothetical protein L0Z50_30695 [Verrucomicrobiales bacterium]|nr:hypothetical protein [Verrucomicrobiales bacterium]
MRLMPKLMLLNNQAPGDIVMLTAAVRDLHRCYPKQFVTDVRTNCMELWENNPYLTPLDISDREVTIVDCRYPLFEKSNGMPVHFLQGFVDDLNGKLGLQIKVSEFKGDIHLSGEERQPPSPIEELTGENRPYWIIVAGGKFDITIKWWHFRRWQDVVDHFRDRIQFVQVGLEGHYHPPLRGVIDLRGKTPLRELIRLVYHAHGVLCPVTLLMHLAAAVPTTPGAARSRPCVVVAGGREAPHWAAYPTHQFIHTVGTLPCCAEGGCWKVRTVPLDDGDYRDGDRYLCVDVVNRLPRCMDAIAADDVIRRVKLYFTRSAHDPRYQTDGSRHAGSTNESSSEGRLTGNKVAQDFDFEPSGSEKAGKKE